METEAYDLSGASGFVGSYFFDGALDFDEVDVLVAQFDDVGEDGLDLGCEG
jgi:hypothetical protein